MTVKEGEVFELWSEESLIKAQLKGSAILARLRLGSLAFGLTLCFLMLNVILADNIILAGKDKKPISLERLSGISIMPPKQVCSGYLLGVFLRLICLYSGYACLNLHPY